MSTVIAIDSAMMRVAIQQAKLQRHAKSVLARYDNGKLTYTVVDYNLQHRFNCVAVAFVDGGVWLRGGDKFTVIDAFIVAQAQQRQRYFESRVCDAERAQRQAIDDTKQLLRITSAIEFSHNAPKGLNRIAFHMPDIHRMICRITALKASA